MCVMKNASTYIGSELHTHYGAQVMADNEWLHEKLTFSLTNLPNSFSLGVLRDRGGERGR